MNNALSLVQLKFDIWLIEQLQITPPPGPTLEELRNKWNALPSHTGSLSRAMLTTHRQNIKTFLGIEIESPDRMHYQIMNPKALALDSLANDLLTSIQNYTFLQEYKELGDLIQPERIETGSRYLQQIGQALRNNQKLSIIYQKFTDDTPYNAVIHPYCLKADKGRWYLFAVKQGSEHKDSLQCFALDRVLSLHLMQETFVPNPDFDATTYFRDCFGIWREFDKYPVRDISISCTNKVAPYLRTLPLHHSQREDSFREGKNGRIIFHYHISPSPDFLAELRKWGREVKIIDEITLKKKRASCPALDVFTTE